jgi:integrase
MRKINRLSPLDVRRKKTGRHADGNGLYLEVTDTGGRSWVFMWKRGGKRRCYGLGSAHTISLKAARELAKKAAEAVNAGRNPIEERRKARARAITFADAAAQCHADIGRGWRSEKGRRQWLSQLIAHTKPLASKVVSEITVDDVERVLTPLWPDYTRRHDGRPELAMRVRERIERVLDWAKAHNYRDGENPARWKGNLKLRLAPLKAKRERIRHMAALAYEQMPAFMTKLRAMDDTMYGGARALEFTILTAARSNETFLAAWNEINFADRLWVVPAERMKMRLAHVVPLSGRALSIIQSQHDIRSSSLIFPGRRDERPMSNTAMLYVLQQLGADCTVHGFRSTFRDWAGDLTRFPRDVIELALAHAPGNAVERAYRRGTALEQRRRLMDDWAAYCEPRADNVIAMRKPIPA